MIRRTVISAIAEEEVRGAKQNFAERSSDRGDEFLSQVRVANRLLQEFPFSKSVYKRVENMEVRRVKVNRFPFWLFYFVHPSVDPNTGEPLDVVYVLACRHERQSEPNWSARDPFQIP